MQTALSTPIRENTEDPFSEELLADPLGFHQRLREASPVVYLSHYDLYAFSRYEMVRSALIDWQGFQSGAGVGLSNFKTEKPWRPPSLLLETDPPHHDAPRETLSKILGPRSLRELAVKWAVDAENLVDDVLSKGCDFDAIEEFAEAFPLRVFPDAVGIRQEGRDKLLPYGDHLFNSFGPENWLVIKGQPGIGHIAGTMNEMCARDQLTPTGFGAEVWAAADRGEITEAQAPLIVRSLLSAGVDTTVHAIGALLYAIAANPEQWQLLRRDPSLVRNSFDEAIRLESPVQTFFRTATADISVDGCIVPAGKKILMFLGAANRDPRRWTSPDAFDVRRDPSGHVGFGMGIHQCVGQHVARLEAVSLITALLERVESIEMTGKPQRHLNNTMRALSSLPVRVTAGSR